MGIRPAYLPCPSTGEGPERRRNNAILGGDPEQVPEQGTGHQPQGQ